MSVKIFSWRVSLSLISLSFLSVFEFTWNEMCYINKNAMPCVFCPLSASLALFLLTATVQWRHQRHIKRQRGGEIKVISLYLACFFLFSELCIYSIPIPWAFHSLSSFFPPSPSAFALSHGGKISLLQRPDDVQTWPLRLFTKEWAFSFSFWLSESLCSVREETKTQSLQRLSIALASHLLFSHDSDPATPWDSLFSHGW